MSRIHLAAEQAAHPKSGPRRRPHELPGSLVTHENLRRTTHTNCSPIIPARFRRTVRARGRRQGLKLTNHDADVKTHAGHMVNLTGDVKGSTIRVSKIEMPKQ